MSLRRIRSTLIKAMELIMCNTCIEKKYEPRFIVIISARTAGLEDIVKKVINEKRYIGNEILASDIL